MTKTFPGVVALKDVSFSVRTGEVHGIVDENGAGKSTLIKAIMGVHQLNGGTITLHCGSQWVTPQNTLEAKEYGMYANYQHVNIASTLSVGENYFLGQMPQNKLGLIHWKKVYDDSVEILRKFNLTIDPRSKMSDLPIALQEMVMISKISVMKDLRLVIFDEPTALLENEKVETLFAYINELKKRGISIIYISHHLEEIIRICDRATVLKDGQFVATKDITEVDRDALISMMVGRKVEDIYNISHPQQGEVALQVENLSCNGQFSNVNFTVRRGEILGFFGLVGAGRTEVMKTLYGVNKPSSGKILVSGKEVHPASAAQAMHYGIGLIPEDRAKEGVALDLDIKVNINLNSYDMISTGGIINIKKEANRAEKYVKKVGIKTPSIRQKVSNLSGGNQQKVVISKLLCRNLDVFIFDEPTVGVDIGAKQEIYRLIEKLSGEGKAIIIISSYLPEVMGLSDQLIVMTEGRVSASIQKEDAELWNEKQILKLASTEQ